jgi:amidase
VPTRGIRTTSGSPDLQGQRADGDHLIVERLTAAGAITLGKTNLPEFAAGSHTFNLVFGATLNPYDPSQERGRLLGRRARPQWPAACCLSPTAATSPHRCAIPATYCNVVGFGLPPGACRTGRRRTPGTRSACSGRSRAPSTTRVPACRDGRPGSQGAGSIAEPGTQFLKP